MYEQQRGEQQDFYVQLQNKGEYLGATSVRVLLFQQARGVYFCVKRNVCEWENEKKEVL